MVGNKKQGSVQSRKDGQPARAFKSLACGEMHVAGLAFIIKAGALALLVSGEEKIGAPAVRFIDAGVVSSEFEAFVLAV